MAGILKVDRVQSDSNLAFQVGSANVAYINSTGLNITGGEIIAGGSTLRTTSGLIYANNGIKFPTTQVSSADANTLDDYEEGTFTPTTTNYPAGTGTPTYSLQTGSYTKVGRLVTVSCRITLTAFTGTGGYLISNLPFVNAGPDYVGAVMTSGLTYAVGYTSVVYLGGATTQAFIWNSQTAGTWGYASVASGNSDVIATLTYITN